jgi:hypothetical protein
MPFWEEWRGIGIVAMACQAVEEGKFLEGQVAFLSAFEGGGSRSGRFEGCRHNWEILVESRL